MTGCSAKNGAVIYALGNITLDGCSITGNSAATSGGALYMSGSGAISLTDCSITGNSAATSGGAIYMTGAGTTSLTGCSITGCSAPNGAAVYADRNATLDGCSITGNNATSGGAVQVHAASRSLYLQGSIQIKNNTFNGTPGHNFYLNYDAETIINASGLASDAEVYVYTSDDWQNSRGTYGKVFGSYSDDANLNRIFNERITDENDLPVQGIAYDGNRISWQGYDVELNVLSSSDNTTPLSGARFSRHYRCPRQSGHPVAARN